MKRFVLIASLTFAPYTSVLAADGDLWVVVVAMLCSYQNQNYKATFFKTENSKDATFNDARSSKQNALMQCLGSAQWISKDLCQSVVYAKPGELDSPQRLYDKHSREIRQLGPLVEYMEMVENAKPSEAIPCPSYDGWVESNKAAYAEEIRTNLSCNAIEPKAFQAISGLQIIELEPTKTNEIASGCYYKISTGGPLLVEASLNPTLPDDTPVNCANKTRPDGPEDGALVCWANKTSWTIRVYGRDFASDLGVVRQLTDYVISHVTFPQKNVERLRNGPYYRKRP